MLNVLDGASDLNGIKVGVIGCGAVLERCHLPAVRGISSVEIRALADVNERRMEWIMEKFDLKDASAYTDYYQLLKDADVDAVWILTPPKLHARMIADALKSGKHIFCEKPIATCSRDIKVIEEALKQNRESLILMPAHNFIFTPCFEKAVEYIRDGFIGEIERVYGRAVSNLSFYKAVTNFRIQAKGGVIEDQLPHVIYLAQDLCGSIVKVKSIRPHTRGRTLVEDVDVEVEFKNGVKGLLSAAWSNSIPTFKFEVEGDSGKLSMDLLRAPFNLTLIKEGRKKVIHMGHRLTQYFNVLLGRHPSYRREHLHFIDLVRGLVEPRISVEGGLELGRALENIMKFIDEGDFILKSRKENLVSIIRVNSNCIEKSVRESIRLLGGLNIPKGASVVVKPNVCFWKNTDGMIITDPRLLRAVLEIVKERTDKILVVESDNNSGTAEKRLKRSGIMDVIEESEVDFLNLSRDEFEEHEVAGFKIRIPKTVLKAEYFINMPKIKTCNVANTVVSIAMKNMFGILGNRKKMVFHKKLLDILLYLNRIIRQDLIIVDGIIGMEGLGPVWGKPVDLGLIVSGFNPVTVDAVCCRIMDINPYSVELLWRAYKTKMGEMDVEKIEILGERIESIKRRFSRPTLLVDNLVGAIRATLKTYLG